MKFTEKQLYKWMLHQRQRCADDPRKRALLEKIPGWVWSLPNEDAWEKGFAQLQKHGIPTLTKMNEETPDGFCLGSWVNNQRTRCTDPKKRKRLESIPGWAWDAQAAKWERGFTYLKNHGKTPLRTVVTKDGFKLGVWVENQRSACVDPARRKRLEAIPGWTWYPMNAKVSRK